nr:NAD-dependent epimerase/dehydratase family protein [Methanobacterium formicicum]
MKIIIAGGAGFVGRNLVRVMLQNGFKENEIVVIDFNQENLEYFREYNIKTLFADLSKKGEWEKEFENSDYLINLAAQISSPEYEPFHRNNVLNTQNLINAAKENGTKRIIHFSSAAVLSVRKDDYANTKSEGENLVKDSGLEYCIIRPSLMYGPTDDKNIGYLIKFAKKIPIFPHTWEW